MRDRGRFHSQIVAGAKLLLPLLAVGLLSTLFLFSRRGDVTSDIPFAEIEELAREQQVSGPSYSGTTREGGTVSIEAESMRPVSGGANRFALSRLRGQVEASDGSVIDIAAGEAEVDGAEETAQMSGLVRLTSSSGFVMETSALDADLSTGRLVTRGPLEAQAPYGSLTAGKLTVTDEGLDREGARMDFTGGVRLLYDPRDERSADP